MEKLVADNNWPETQINIPTSATLNIRDYLDKYGFIIEIDRNIEDSINDAIRNPGSYYIYNSGGSLIVVVPSASQVFFIYAG